MNSRQQLDGKAVGHQQGLGAAVGTAGEHGEHGEGAAAVVGSADRLRCRRARLGVLVSSLLHSVPGARARRRPGAD